MRKAIAFATAAALTTMAAAMVVTHKAALHLNGPSVANVSDAELGTITGRDYLFPPFGYVDFNPQVFTTPGYGLYAANQLRGTPFANLAILCGPGCGASTLAAALAFDPFSFGIDPGPVSVPQSTVNYLNGPFSPFNGAGGLNFSSCGITGWSLGLC